MLKMREVAMLIAAITITTSVVMHVCLALWEHGFSEVHGWLYVLTAAFLAFYLWKDYFEAP